MDPLKFRSDFDISYEFISKSLKGMSSLNPEARYRTPYWSMDLVLQFIIDNKNNNSLLLHTQKTLSLMGLAFSH